MGVSGLSGNNRNSLFIAYLFYTPRYMRNRLLKSEAQLTGLLPGGEEDFHKLFGRVSALKPQLATWALFSIALFAEINIVPLLLPAPATAQSTSVPVTVLGNEIFTVANLLLFFVATLVLSSTAWVYYCVLKGIHRMGNAALNFSPFYRDSFLGLKPVGSLALSLAAAYFGFEAFLIAAGFASTPTLADLFTVGGLLIGLVAMGVLAFFLPLRKLHGRMAQEKASERVKLSERFALILDQNRGMTEQSTDEKALEVLKLDLMDRKVSSIATWPFDFQILGKLTIITLSVTAALLTRFIALFLRV